MSERHGLARSREHQAWQRMKSRCLNKNNPDYSEYGGRGIEVCKRWRNSFINFFEDMGIRPSDIHSIDRINVNGNYEPSNCKWATPEEQANNRRNSRYLEFKGQVKSIAQWAREIGISEGTLRSRINKQHWSAERALSEPVNEQYRS